MGNFKTCGEAWRYCEKYGLNNITAGHSFQIAEALFRAYNDGAIQPVVEAEAEYRCFFCSTPTQPTKKGQVCPECGGRPA